MESLFARIWGIIESKWHTRAAAWCSPLVVAVVAFLSATSIGANSPTRLSWAISIISGFLTAVVWVLTNRVPRTPKDKVGLVIALSADDENQERQLRDDFIVKLQRLHDREDIGSSLEVLVMPNWLSARTRTKEAANEVLVRSRGHMIVYGSAKRRTVGGQETHVLELEGQVRHTPVSKDVGDEMAKDFRAALPSRLIFPDNNSVFSFAASSAIVELAAVYVIGLAAFVSGDVRYAERMLLAAEGQMKQTRLRPTGFSRIAERLPTQILSMYRVWLDALVKAYITSRKDEFLVQAERVALATLSRRADDYQAVLAMAMADFVLRRDTKAAIKRVFACRKQKDQTWRFSYAFLLTYEGRMREAREQYRIAFNGITESVTVPVQTEEFIQLVLESEPGKCQLHFASALINIHAKGDTLAAKNDLQLFLASKTSMRFPEEVRLAYEMLNGLDMSPVHGD